MNTKSRLPLKVSQRRKRRPSFKHPFYRYRFDPRKLERAHHKLLHNSMFGYNVPPMEYANIVSLVEERNKTKQALLDQSIEPGSRWRYDGRNPILRTVYSFGMPMWLYVTVCDVTENKVYYNSDRSPTETNEVSIRTFLLTAEKLPDGDLTVQPTYSSFDSYLFEFRL